MNDSQQEILIKLTELHTDIKYIKENIQKLNHTIYGNGKPGLVEDLKEIKILQTTCPARKEFSDENKKWKKDYIFSGIAIIISILAFIFKFI